MPTRCELIAKAKEKGLKGYSKMKKPELQALIEGGGGKAEAPKKTYAFKKKEKEAPKPAPLKASGTARRVKAKDTAKGVAAARNKMDPLELFGQLPALAKLNILNPKATGVIIGDPGYRFKMPPTERNSEKGMKALEKHFVDGNKLVAGTNRGRVFKDKYGYYKKVDIKNLNIKLKDISKKLKTNKEEYIEHGTDHDSDITKYGELLGKSRPLDREVAQRELHKRFPETRGKEITLRFGAQQGVIITGGKRYTIDGEAAGLPARIQVHDDKKNEKIGVGDIYWNSDIYRN